ncbi:hypothetical protein GCM10008020_39780 [Massilia psychrophila]|jgi:cob(I)alamin adenosyltransferase|nr:hypothetical protein GCM10008020_39780 [Massilia psychrophila]
MKVIIDEKVKAAHREIGIVAVNAGNGKGGMSTGEEELLRRFPDEVSLHAMGEGSTWETQDRQRDIDKAGRALAWCCSTNSIASSSTAT